MKTTKKIALTGVLAALYFVLSLSLKIPMVGHISLDLGYLALTVAAVMLGPLPAALVGAIGAAVESILLSPFGLSIGWVVMNFYIGMAVGIVLHNYDCRQKQLSKFIPACVVILCAVCIGVGFKTVIECSLYQIPPLVKLPKSFTAFVVDSTVMITGLPLVGIIQKKIKNIS